MELFRQAAIHEPDDFRTWGNIGDALSAMPATAAQAPEAYRRAAQRAAAYVKVKSEDARVIAQLAWFRANLGDDREARDLIARSEALGTDQGEVALWSAQTLAVLGDLDAARAQLARARRAGITKQRIQALPHLRRLLDTAAPAVSTAG
ncbi:MAG TPA: hypothetical protein VNI56_04685 [Xanthomonadaceae bacterium]|nr:hypothetical protein [Xanthomonadaceae bacterium]